MKAKEIRDLIDFISETGLEEVNIETQEFKIKVKRTPNVSSPVSGSTLPTIAPAATPTIAAAPAPTTPSEAPKASTADDQSSYVTIKSPMIGTFYESQNPESPVFAKVGDSVKAGDPVCIIEAMKLFNEVESEVSGKVVKVLVENAQPVEFDQPLFIIDPS